MKRFSEQFKKQSESITLRASERKALRERIVSYMEYHPLPDAVKKKAPAPQYIPAEPFSVIRINPVYFRSFAGVFAVVLLVGIPFVAEKAMPGDVLYPVKVQFNEELRSSLALSPYAKVEWETQRLERRLAEARLLANEGKLTEEAETQVAQAVKDHSEAAQREIAALRESDSDEAAIAEITLASALAVQTEVLENHIEKDQSENKGGNSVVALAQAVAEARDSAEAAQSGVQPSYDKLLGRVESESTRVYEIFASVKKEATSDEAQDVERRIADIERKIAQATALKEGRTLPSAASATARTMAAKVSATEDASVSDASTTPEGDVALMSMVAPSAETATNTEATDEADAVQDSIEILRSALADIQKLVSYMTHIDVRANVTIDELVPISLTPEEQTQEVTGLLDETIALQEQIATRAISSKMAEKVAEGQEELEEKIAACVGAMQNGDVETARAIITDAHALAVDIDRLTAREPLKEVPQIETQASSSESLQ